MKTLAIVILFLFSFRAAAVPNEKIFHFYGAFGELYGFNSYRIGHKNWEIGKLNAQSAGLVKLLYKGNVYAGFGFAVSRGLGFHGSLGFDLPFWNVFSFRGELNASNSFNNYSHGEALVGFTFHL